MLGRPGSAFGNREWPAAWIGTAIVPGVGLTAGGLAAGCDAVDTAIAAPAAAAAPAAIAGDAPVIAVALPTPGAKAVEEFVTLRPACAKAEVAPVSAVVAVTVTTPANEMDAVCPVKSASDFPPAVTVTSPGAQSKHVITSPFGPVEYKPTVPRTASCDVLVPKR